MAIKTRITIDFPDGQRHVLEVDALKLNTRRKVVEVPSDALAVERRLVGRGLLTLRGLAPRWVE